MSKDKSDFESSDKPEYIENVDSFTKDGNRTDIYLADEDDVPFSFTLNHALTIIFLIAGYMADLFIANLSNAMYSTIMADVGPAPQGFNWSLAIPTLCGALTSPVVGRASDMFGRKYFQLGASVLGIIGSAVTAKTNSITVLLGFSGILGLATAGHQLALVSIAEIFPRKYRALIIGLFFFALTPAVGFSTWIGGALAAHSTWRVTYWLALGLYIFSLIGTFLFYHPEELEIQKTDSLRSRITHFDYTGCFLWLGGVTTLACGLIFGGVVFPWISVGCFVPTFIGLAVVFMFLPWVVFNRVQYPFVPRTLLSLDIRLGVIIGCIFFIGMVSSTANGMFPTQVQILYTHDPVHLGKYTMAYGLATSLFAPIAGALFFPKRARWILVGYSTVLFITGSTQAIAGKNTATGSTVLVAFVGAMHGATIVVTTAMIMLGVKHQDLGVATQFAFGFFTYGGVAYGVIDQVMVKNKIKVESIALVVPALIKAGVPFLALPEAVPDFMNGKIEGNPIFANINFFGLLAAVEAMKEAYIHVFRFVYLVSILFGALAAIISFFTKNVDAPVTSHVDARLKSSRRLVPGRNHQV